MKFIKLNSINASNSQADTKIWIRVDQIIEVINPTCNDLKQRKEINALVRTVRGDYYAVSQFPHDILEEIKTESFDS